MANIYRKSEIPEHLQKFFVPAEIGLEKTPAEYVARMVAVFEEVRRVLSADGTLWLNLGDSYATSSKGGVGGGKRSTLGIGANGEVRRSEGSAQRWVARSEFQPVSVECGLPEKNLLGIPWRVAFALQDAGWYLRQDIIWAKPNPMPESITDRCTKAHEYIFLLTKSARYHYDAESIAEPVTLSTVARLSQPGLLEQVGSDQVPGKTNGTIKAVGPRFGGTKYGDSDEPAHQTKSGNVYDVPGPEGRRNKRSVWTVASQPFTGAHFAVYPEALIRPCIRAGCKPGGLVLDPFTGSGTTGMVAVGEGRRFVGLELNPDYACMARRRLANTQAPLFAQ